ncbi:hypothetical protein [Streptomyces sp. NPDC051016]|uniref:hypothetical protein n=1 Tax=Streptomyces sp. NPDC051016 TaxID=3365638 RepID=UPI0037BCDA7F
MKTSVSMLGGSSFRRAMMVSSSPAAAGAVVAEGDERAVVEGVVVVEPADALGAPGFKGDGGQVQVAADRAPEPPHDALLAPAGCLPGDADAQDRDAGQRLGLALGHVEHELLLG